MSDAEQEREWWNSRATSFQLAKEYIAADDSAWDGTVLERSIEQIMTPDFKLSLLAAFSRPARVLDLGCGAGRLAIPLIAKLPRRVTIVGVDIAPEMLRRAWERTPARYANRLEWLLGDGRTLPDEVGTLHAAYSAITFQHIPHEAQAGYVKAVADRLVSGGVFRFQLYEGAADTFLAHHVHEEMAWQWCKDAGLVVGVVNRVVPNVEAEGMALWITAVKR